MKIGLTLSPGGLMLPYHMGVLAGLEYNGFIHKETTPIIGSSAGAIAAASYGCGLEPMKILDATIDLSDRCEELGGARGRLLPILNEKMGELITEDYHFKEILQNREGIVGAAYRQIFPETRDFVQTKFDSREDLFRAVSHSCMFPFFSTNLPFNMEWGGMIPPQLPRLYVDGYFTVPRDRFGCPDFAMVDPTITVKNDNNDIIVGGNNSERKDDRKYDFDDDNKYNNKDSINRFLDIDTTLAISVFPKEIIGLTSSEIDDCISPPTEEEGGLPFSDLINIATKTSSADELTKIYDGGFQDAETWCRTKQRRPQKRQKEVQEKHNRKRT